MSLEEYRKIVKTISVQWKKMTMGEQSEYKRKYVESKEVYEKEKKNVKLFNAFEKIPKTPNMYL